MSWVKRVWYHTYSWSETISGVIVMTQIRWMPFQIYWWWCHEYSECDVIHNVVWCHKIWTWCFIECIWYFTYSGCHVLYSKRVILLKEWVWWHTFSSCDVICNGYDVFIYSGWNLKNSVGVISSIQWMWWHRSSGYDVKYSGCDVIKTVAWCHKVRMWSLV